MTEEEFSPEVKLVREKLSQIYPILAGVDGSVVGAVVGDLVATWVSGHMVRRIADGQQVFDKEATDKVRKELLGDHVGLVLKLVAVNDWEGENASEKRDDEQQDHAGDDRR